MVFVKHDRISHERYGTGEILGDTNGARVAVVWDDRERGTTTVLKCNVSKSTTMGPGR